MSASPKIIKQRPTDDATYDPAFFSLLFSVEDKHFWFRARNRIIYRLVTQITESLKPGYRVLEVGCGTGNVLRFLEKACLQGHVAGIDLFANSLTFAQQRVSCPLIQCDLRQTPFIRSFDLIGMFDVLEHIPNDEDVLRDIYALLKPGGAILLTVPAYMSLWSYFDVAAHHSRRYEYHEMRDKLIAAGFNVTYLTPYMATLFPAVWVARRVATSLASRHSDHTANIADQSREMAEREFKITPGVNRLLTQILYLEARLIAHRIHLPIGTSLLALAYKKD